MLTADTQPTARGHHAGVHDFLENFSDVLSSADSSSSILSRDQQIFRDNQLAGAGMKIATNATPDQQTHDQDLSEQKKMCHAFMLAAVSTGTLSTQQRLSGWTLNDATINKKGMLQIKGEDGKIRDATLEEKVILEENSHACSVGLTPEEIEMNKYFNDPNAKLPESLRKIALEQELNPNELNKGDYAAILEQKYPDNAQRIIFQNDITAPLTLESLSGLNNDVTAGISANPANTTTIKLGKEFELKSNIVLPTPNASIPNASAPNTAPNITNVTAGTPKTPDFTPSPHI